MEKVTRTLYDQLRCTSPKKFRTDSGDLELLTGGSCEHPELHVNVNENCSGHWPWPSSVLYSLGSFNEFPC